MAQGEVGRGVRAAHRGARRLVGDAAQAQPDRLPDRAVGRDPRAGPGQRYHRRPAAGARARPRRLAGRGPGARQPLRAGARRAGGAAARARGAGGRHRRAWRAISRRRTSATMSATPPSSPGGPWRSASGPTRAPRRRICAGPLDYRGVRALMVAHSRRQDGSDEPRLLRRAEAAAGPGAPIPGRALPAGGGARHPRGAASPTTGRSTRASPSSGVLGAAIPEAYGGVGLSSLELCLMAEELGRVLAPVPVASSIYLWPPNSCCSQAPRRRSRPGCRSWPAARRLVRSRCAEGAGRVRRQSIRAGYRDGRLTGVKTAVPDGEVADVAIVLATSPGGRAALAVPGRPRRSGRLPPRPGDHRSHPQLCEADLRRRDGRAAGRGGRRLAALAERVIDRAAILTAFEQVGGADRALEMARDYALERMAFGRQIGSFQAIKHMLADMYVSATLARSNCYYGAWALSTERRGAAGVGGHRRGSRPPRRSSTAPRTTSRSTAAWASPGPSTATSSTGAPTAGPGAGLALDLGETC